METDSTIDSDLSFNKMSEMCLINDLQVLAWYFRYSAYCDRLADKQLKPDIFFIWTDVEDSLKEFLAFCEKCNNTRI